MSFCYKPRINNWHLIEIFPQTDYNTICNTHPPNPMPVSYYNPTLNKYRITLELDVLDDFNPRQIDWAKVLDIGADESVVSYTEELDIDPEW